MLNGDVVVVYGSVCVHALKYMVNMSVALQNTCFTRIGLPLTCYVDKNVIEKARLVSPCHLQSHSLST